MNYSQNDFLVQFLKSSMPYYPSEHIKSFVFMIPLMIPQSVLF